MSIPDEAVEAALCALFPDSEAVSAFTRAVQVPVIRTVLVAAAPHLMADAWEECAQSPSRPDPKDNPYRHAGAGE